MHLRDLLETLLKQLAYVQTILTNSAGLATWEKREYEALKADYTTRIADAEQRIAVMNEVYGVRGW